MIKWKNLFKTFGPGILFASTAIGVSHLVQSTRAGAEYGFSLLIFVLLANILKYPFFELALDMRMLLVNLFCMLIKNEGVG